MANGSLPQGTDSQNPLSARGTMELVAPTPMHPFSSCSLECISLPLLLPHRFSRCSLLFILQNPPLRELLWPDTLTIHSSLLLYLIQTYSVPVYPGASRCRVEVYPGASQCPGVPWCFTVSWCTPVLHGVVSRCDPVLHSVAVYPGALQCCSEHFNCPCSPLTSCVMWGILLKFSVLVTSPSSPEE